MSIALPHPLSMCYMKLFLVFHFACVVLWHYIFWLIFPKIPRIVKWKLSVSMVAIVLLLAELNTAQANTQKWNEKNKKQNPVHHKIETWLVLK